MVEACYIVLHVAKDGSYLWSPELMEGITILEVDLKLGGWYAVKSDSKTLRKCPAICESRLRYGRVEVRTALVFFNNDKFRDAIAYAPGFGRVGCFTPNISKKEQFYDAWITYFEMCNERSIQNFLVIFDVKWLLSIDCCVALGRMDLNQYYFKKSLKWFEMAKGIVVQNSEKDGHIFNEELFCSFSRQAGQPQLSLGTFVQFIPVLDFSHGFTAVNVCDIGSQSNIEVLPFKNTVRLSVSNWVVSKEGGLIDVPGLCKGISTGNQMMLPLPTSSLIIEFNHTFKTFMVVLTENDLQIKNRRASMDRKCAAIVKVPAIVQKPNENVYSPANKAGEHTEMFNGNTFSESERIKSENFSSWNTPKKALPNEDGFQLERSVANAFPADFKDPFQFARSVSETLPTNIAAQNPSTNSGGSFGRNRILMPIHPCPFPPQQPPPSFTTVPPPNFSIPPPNFSIPPSSTSSSMNISPTSAAKRAFGSSPTNIDPIMASSVFNAKELEGSYSISQSAKYKYTRSQLMSLRQAEGKKLQMAQLTPSYHWPSVRSADGPRFFEIFVRVPPSIMRSGNTTRIHRSVLVQFRNPAAKSLLIRPVAACYLFESGYTFLRFEWQAEARAVWMYYQNNQERLRHESGEYFHLQLPQI